MRLLKWILIGLLLLGGIFVTGGFFLPDVVRVQRAVQIKRQPAQVFPLLNGFARFNEWSPWADYDPSASYSLEGPASGVGATLRWHGEKGEGSQKITALEPDERIDVALEFGDAGRGTASFLLTPRDTGTELVWSFTSDFEGNFVGRWMGMFFDRMIGPDYERGLAAFKRLAESEPPPAPPAPTASLPGEETGTDQDESSEAEVDSDG